MSGIREHKANLLIKAKSRPEGYSRIVRRGEMGLKHLEFGLLRLSSGDWSGKTGKCEQALDIYSGVISLDAPGFSCERLGGRKSVFEGAPTVIYLPPGVSYRISVLEGPVEIGIVSATARDFKGEPFVIGPGDLAKQSVGRDNWRMDVWGVLEKDAPVSKLIFGEALVPPGNWGSAPPHKHDAFNPPKEAPYEEIWYIQVSPVQGFGVVRVYTGPNDPGPMNETFTVENGDTVVIPRGYHLLGVAPGYAVNCTYALAGDTRIPGAVSPDPRHAWILGNG